MICWCFTTSGALKFYSFKISRLKWWIFSAVSIKGTKKWESKIADGCICSPPTDPTSDGFCCSHWNYGGRYLRPKCDAWMNQISLPFYSIVHWSSKCDIQNELNFSTILFCSMLKIYISLLSSIVPFFFCVGCICKKSNPRSRTEDGSQCA